MNMNDLKKIRKQIVLGSLFTSDFENSFDIPAKTVQDFFDGFLDYIYDEVQYSFGPFSSPEESDKTWEDHWEEFDTPDVLYEYYLCFEVDPLPITIEEDE